MKGKEKSGFIAPPCKTILKLKHISATIYLKRKLQNEVSHRKPPLPSSGWKRPLRRNDPYATRLLSMVYRHIPELQNNAKGMLHLRRSAEMGNASAQFDLGRTLFQDKNSPAKRKEAVVWLEKAAATGRT